MAANPTNYHSYCPRHPIVNDHRHHSLTRWQLDPGKLRLVRVLCSRSNLYSQSRGSNFFSRQPKIKCLFAQNVFFKSESFFWLSVSCSFYITLTTFTRSLKHPSNEFHHPSDIISIFHLTDGGVAVSVPSRKCKPGNGKILLPVHHHHRPP